jgi:hypothetical protein
MPQRTELEFYYDENSFPVGAKCGICGEEMPKNETDLLAPAADAVLWFSEQFLIHKRQKHPH